MLSTWLFIIFFSPWEAQVMEMQNQRACLEIKTYAEKQIKEKKLEGKIVTGCFRNMGERTKES